jgi:hypothetical protein
MKSIIKSFNYLLSKTLSQKKGGKTNMKKSLILGLFVLVLISSFANAAITNYSFLTTTGWNATGNQINGSCIYNPALDAVFNGQYNTSATANRHNIIGWSVDSTDPTYSTVTPKYFIRNRMYGNGLKLSGLVNNNGRGDLKDGKIYTTADFFLMTNLNFVPREYVPVNADSVTITFPNVSANNPIYSVVGVSSSASNLIEDANGAPSLLAANVATTFVSASTDPTGWRVILPSNGRALVAVAGVFTSPTGVAPNYFTGGGFTEAARSIWLNTIVPGAPREVFVSYTDGRFNPNTGVIDLSTTIDPGTMLFTSVGQLQPTTRAIYKWDATTLAAETGVSIFGTPAMYILSTVAQVTTLGTSTVIDVSVPTAYPVTDQYQIVKEIGGNTGKARLAIASYGNFTVGPIASASSTQVVVNLNGIPYSAIVGVWTINPPGASTNFWSRRAFASSTGGWVLVTDTTKIVVPWGPIDQPAGIWTDSTKIGKNFLTGQNGATEGLSFKAGSTGGWWNVSEITPTLYASVGGIDTSLSNDSAWIQYTSPPPDNITPGISNFMDTTGIINLYNPLPGAGTNVWVGYNCANGIDVANNRVRGLYATGTPVINAGDTVYVSMLYQGGSNPYNLTGPGTAGNRAIGGNNPYGVALDNAGNYFVTQLFSQYGIHAFDASGNFIARYPIKGARSTVTRGGIAVDTITNDLYWADQGGGVWKFTKTGGTLDTYVQDTEPFFIGSVLGGAIDQGGMTPMVVVKSLPTLTGGWTTLVFISTNNSANNGNALNAGTITIMKPDGTIDAKISGPSTPLIDGRGLDVSPDGKRVFYSPFASQTGAYSQVYVYQDLNGPVPIELSVFESVID